MIRQCSSLDDSPFNNRILSRSSILIKHLQYLYNILFNINLFSKLMDETRHEKLYTTKLYTTYYVRRRRQRADRTANILFEYRSRQECAAIGQARYNVVTVSNLLTRMRCDSVHAIPRIKLLCFVQHSLHMNAPQNYTGAAGDILTRCKS